MLVAAAALLVSGCDDPLVFAQSIESTRVLGARVEVSSEPSRSSPLPGETASATWLVADPRPEPPIGWELSACIGEPKSRGVPTCGSPVFATARSSAPSTAAPVLDFTVPSDASGRILLSGAICGDGQPVIATPLENSSCDGELTLVVMELPALEAGESNTNPSLAGAALTFDAMPWPAPDAALLARTDCSAQDQAPELPVVSAEGRSHTIAAVVPASSRDVVDGLDGAALESLQISHYSTAGKLASVYSAIDGAAEGFTTSWRAPKAVPEAGGLVRFYVVARDLRGGVDWTIRTACVVP